MRILPEELGEEVLLLERGSAELSSAHAALGMLRGGIDPRRGLRRRPPSRRARRARPQRQPRVRLARAGRGPQGRRADGPAPPPVPAGVRDRDVPRSERPRLHALPRAPHVLGRAAALPRLAARGGGLRRGAADVVTQACRARRRAGHAERLHDRAAADDGRAAAGPRGHGDRQPGARGRARKADPPTEARDRVGPVLAPTRASTSRSRRARSPACRSSITGDGPDETELRALAQRLGADVTVRRARARRGARGAAGDGGAGDRPVAVRRDVRAVGGRVDGLRDCRSSARVSAR